MSDDAPCMDARGEVATAIIKRRERHHRSFPIESMPHPVLHERVLDIRPVFRVAPTHISRASATAHPRRPRLGIPHARRPCPSCRRQRSSPSSLAAHAREPERRTLRPPTGRASRKSPAPTTLVFRLARPAAPPVRLRPWACPRQAAMGAASRTGRRTTMTDTKAISTAASSSRAPPTSPTRCATGATTASGSGSEPRGRTKTARASTSSSIRCPSTGGSRSARRASRSNAATPAGGPPARQPE